MSIRPERTSLLTLVLSLVVAACAAPGTTPGVTPSPSPSPTGEPSRPPAASPSPSQSVVVTIRVADRETFKVRLTDPEDIRIAYDLLAGKDAPGIPNGKVVRGDPDVNDGYSWHLDPNDFEWADVTIEVCDGMPSDVERGTITSDRYCTWAAKVIAVEPLS